MCNRLHYIFKPLFGPHKLLNNALVEINWITQWTIKRLGEFGSGVIEVVYVDGLVIYLKMDTLDIRCKARDE
jgi:hypothetical protein